MRTIGIITLLLVAQAAWAYPDLTVTAPNTAVGDLWYGATVNNLVVDPGASLISTGVSSWVWMQGSNSVIQGTIGAPGNGITMSSFGTSPVTFSGNGQWVDYGTGWTSTWRAGVILDNSVTNVAYRLSPSSSGAGSMPLNMGSVTLIGNDSAPTVAYLPYISNAGNNCKVYVQHGVGQDAELDITSTDTWGGQVSPYTGMISFGGLNFNGTTGNVSRIKLSTHGWDQGGAIRWGRVGMEYAMVDADGYVKAFDGVRGNSLIGAAASANILLDATSPAQDFTDDVAVNTLKIDGAVNINLNGKNFNAGGGLSSQIIKTGTGASVISGGTVRGGNVGGWGEMPLFITNDSDLTINADISASHIDKNGPGKLTLGGNLVGNATRLYWYEGDLVLNTNSDVYLGNGLITTSGKLTKNGSGTLYIDPPTGPYGYDNLSTDGMLIAGGKVVVNTYETWGSIGGKGLVEFQNGATLAMLGYNDTPILMTNGVVEIPANYMGMQTHANFTIKNMTKTGAGPLWLMGPASIDGALAVTGGAVNVAAATTVTAGPVTGQLGIVNNYYGTTGNLTIQTGAGSALAGATIVQPYYSDHGLIIDNNTNGDTTIGSLSTGDNPLIIQSNAGANTTVSTITTNGYNTTLIKNGPGALTLAGTLTTTRGDRPAGFVGLTWNDGPLNLNYNSGNVTFFGDMPNQPLTMNGNGTLTLNRFSGRNNSTVGMVITGGQVVAEGGDNYADGGRAGGILGTGLAEFRDGATLTSTGFLDNPIRLSNAKLVRYDSWTNGTASTFSVDVPAGKTGTIDAQIAPMNDVYLYNKLDLNTLTGSGTLAKTGPGAIQISQGGSFSGTIHVQQGTLVVYRNWYDSYNGGIWPSNLPANSKVLLDSGTMLLGGGWPVAVAFGKETIAGNGNIFMPDNKAIFQGTTLKPGDAGVGTLHFPSVVRYDAGTDTYRTAVTSAEFAADPTTGALSKLMVDVTSATSYDMLDVTGNVTGLENLDLIVNIANGLNLKGQVLTVITTTGDLSGLLVHSATFGSKYTGTVTGVLGGLILSDIKLAAIPGDANHSGLVDQDDYKIWYDNYGTGTTWEQGNFKGSGVTDQDDYKTWYDNYGVGTAGGAVPEPATMALLALGGLAMLRRRK